MTGQSLNLNHRKDTKSPYKNQIDCQNCSFQVYPLNNLGGIFQTFKVFQTLKVFTPDCFLVVRD